jgi:hypothetical protein
MARLIIYSIVYMLNNVIKGYSFADQSWTPYNNPRHQPIQASQGEKGCDFNARNLWNRVFQ